MSVFSEEEYRKCIAALKYNKAAGIDNVLVEQLKNLGPRAHKWLLTMLRKCLTENKIPSLETIEDYRHIEAREKLCDSKEL